MIEVLLRPGDSGDLVNQVITSLNRIGLLHSTPENYDQSVADAVALFQQQRGLTSTGNVNNQTFAALEEARWKLGDRSLYLQPSPLMRGDDVAQLQSRLTDMGFDCGRVDGIFGQKTESAIKEFQKSVGVTVDGKCGPATVLVNLIKAVTVAGPHLPSTVTPTDFWNSFIALSVFCPKIPSTRPQSKPISVKRLCNCATSSPRINGEGCK